MKSLAGCPGRRIAATGSLLGICIACARQKDGARDLKPAAAPNERRVWACVNWSAE